ncbi:MFS transporter [Novosphingobium sp. SG751A]|uniref:MFS transporter n=1 Tax=Novosphingobium sp. SG751A TaxID=2587000 RepID=UPI003530000D
MIAEFGPESRPTGRRRGEDVGDILRAKRYFPFAALLLANFMEVLNAMFVNVSMPVVARDLHASSHITHWFYSSYALGFALTLVLTGPMADRIGHRRVFLAGAGLYVGASLSCALSGGIIAFLLSRLLQGAAFALTAPQIMGLLHILYAPQDRVRLLPALGFASASAGTFGPVVAGLLISGNFADLGWRVVFMVGAMIGATALLLGYWLLPRDTHRPEDGRDQGFLYRPMPLVIAVGAIMAMFEWLGRDTAGFHPWMMALAALPFLALWRIRRGTFSLRRPWDARSDPTALSQLATGAMLTICFSASSNSLIIIINHILQNGRGHSPYVSGAIQIPYGMGVFFSILFFGRFLLKKDGRFVIAAGAALLALAAPLIMWAGQNPHWPVWALLPILGLAGMGVGMTSGCIGPASMARTAPAHAGASAAALRLGQQIGLALGGALIMRPYFYLSQQPAAGAGPPSYLLVLLFVLATAVMLAASFPRPLFPPRA